MTHRFARERQRGRLSGFSDGFLVGLAVGGLSGFTLVLWAAEVI